jgi:23S rRNA (cytosine1962-C5)-methyltransferase
MAALSRGRSISAHMLSRGEESVEDALRARVRQAVLLRRSWFDPQVTNAYRLINAEGDGIPGLIVDSYNGMLVFQISHPALETIRDLLISLFIEEAKPLAIYEKSTSFLRKKEGLAELQAHRYGVQQEIVEILEEGLKFRVDLQHGQKTGWFLDQREMRKQVRSLSLGKRVLNVFSYTGGFSVAALAGGAKEVASVEISNRCQPLIEQNLILNNLPFEQHRFFNVDAFQFLQSESLNYDLVILDPPAFVKKREDIKNAFRAYKEINQKAMEKLPARSILITCSCSYHVDETLFQNIVFRAALEAKRSVRIIGRHRLAMDHPVSIFHPESGYLKSLVLYLE